MKNKNIKLLVTILAIGVIASIVACLLTGISKKPTITECDFNYSVTYKLNGETKTLAGVYSCKFDGTYPGERYYIGEYVTHGSDINSCTYIIEKKGDYELGIVMQFNESYLMGDTKNYDYEPLEDPYIVVYGLNGVVCNEPEILEMFDVELISFDYPEPIENTFVLTGISEIPWSCMPVTLFIAFLTFIACIIFVKKDPLVVYKDIDKISIVLNVLLAVGGLPIATLFALLLQAFPIGPNFVYIIYLCIPAIVVFSLSASVSLRRNGFSKAGFFVQFIAPVIFFAFVALEYIL